VGLVFNEVLCMTIITPLLKCCLLSNLFVLISSFSLSDSLFSFLSSAPTALPKFTTFSPPSNSTDDPETREYLEQFAASYSFNYDELDDPQSPSSRYLSVADMPPCQFSKLNKYFDLTPLNRGGGPYFTGSEDPPRSYLYQMNICGNIGSASQACSDQGGSICQYLPGTGVFNSVVAKWDENPTPPAIALISPTNPDGGVQIKYTNGFNCVNNGKPVTRTAIVNMPCVKGGTQAMTFTVGFESVAVCVFTITLPSPYSCSSNTPPPAPPSEDSGLSGGSIFLIIFFTVGFAYVAFGCLYLCQVRGSRGIEACPNRDFWSACWGYQKEGCSFTWRKLRGLCGGGGKDYSEL